MVTASQITALFPAASAAHRASFAAKNEALFSQFGVTTANRLHFFLAQIGHESGGLSIADEGLSFSAERLVQVFRNRFPTIADAAPFARNPQKFANTVYGNRMGNGPASSGDGFRFHGRGYMQLTGREGYRKVGALTGLALETDPDLVKAPDNALLVALGFWKLKAANAACDAGDFKQVTKIVNGGTIGMADRLAWLDKVRRVLIPPPPKKLQPSKPLNILVQQALRAKGFTGIGAADGVIGARTTAAIFDFRQREGLGDGLLDDALLAALGITFP